MIKHDLYLARAWYRAHAEFGIKPDWKEFLAIRKAYSEEHRFYHTWQHIYECVRFVDLHYGRQALVVFALFYHDIVYDVARKDNEEKSAERWEAYGMKRQIQNAIGWLKCRQIGDLIRMTATHKVEPGQPLIFSMMNDADMHVFLCPDAHYLLYARGIWQEYKAVGRDKYIEGRLGFLSTIDPNTIFYTHQARELVHHARANLDLEKTILETTPDVILV